MHDVIVIGAGLSGLGCARALAARGLKVLVLEKSRSLGGRCATRLWNGHVVDHGASCFTITRPDFRRTLDEILNPGDLNELAGGAIVRRGNPEIQAGRGTQSTYYLKSGNNRLGKALAATLEIRREHLVESIGRKRGAFLVDDLPCRAVVTSAPWPQTAKLFDQPAEPPHFFPNITAFFEYRGAFAGNSRDAFARIDAGEQSPLWWSACENHKLDRIQGDRSVFVVHASLEFTRRYLETSATEYLPVLRQHLEHRWQLDPDLLLDSFAHRWRYAFVREPEPTIELPDGCFLCGDTRSGSQVEAVWSDGERRAADVAAYLGVS